MAKKVILLLAEGFEEVEVATPVDVLRRAGVEVTVAAVANGLETKGAHGFIYKADVELSKLKNEFDMVVIPGGMPGAKNIGESAEAKALTKNMFDSGKLVASICASPVMTLGAWGMLNGKNATCYPGMESMFPAGVVHSNERVVIDGRITTSKGPGTAMDFALTLAGQLVGQDKANEVANDMLVLK